MIAIKATDYLKNVSYIRQGKDGGFYCVLGNGTAASFSYAGISSNQETEVKIHLESCVSAEEALRIVRSYGSHTSKYEDASPPAPKQSAIEVAAPDMLAALEVIKALIGNVDHSKGGGENSARLYGQMLNDFRDIASAAITKAKGV